MSSSSSRCSNFSHLSEISQKSPWHFTFISFGAKQKHVSLYALQMRCRPEARAGDTPLQTIENTPRFGFLQWEDHGNFMIIRCFACIQSYQIISNQMKSYQIISNHIKSIKCTKKHRRPCAKPVSHGCRMLQNAAAPHLAGWNPKPGNRYICRGSTRACVT